MCHSHRLQHACGRASAMAWIQYDLRSDSNSPGCRECHRYGWRVGLPLSGAAPWCCHRHERVRERHGVWCGALTHVRWPSNPRPHLPRHTLAPCSLTSVPSGAEGGNGKLYLFGGNDQNVRMNEVHAFDTGVCCTNAPLPARPHARLGTTGRPVPARRTCPAWHDRAERTWSCTRLGARGRAPHTGRAWVPLHYTTVRATPPHR